MQAYSPPARLTSMGTRETLATAALARTAPPTLVLPQASNTTLTSRATAPTRTSMHTMSPAVPLCGLATLRRMQTVSTILAIKSPRLT
jgi:hypothetical protein